MATTGNRLPVGAGALCTMVVTYSEKGLQTKARVGSLSFFLEKWPRPLEAGAGWGSNPAGSSVPMRLHHRKDSMSLLCVWNIWLHRNALR
jgi:hypothetical protein